MLRLLILAAVVLPAAYGESSEYERFGLFNAGRPMTVRLAVAGGNPADIGVERAELESAVVERLRSAGLWTASETEAGGGHLFVIVIPNRDGRFRFSYHFVKMATDEFGNSGPMESPHADGQHTGNGISQNRDGTYVAFVISRALDKFVAAYKRVNGL